MVASTPPESSEDAALRSVHTANLPGLFEQLNISLVVSTYQAGKVILVRNDGGTINTHFRSFAKPMGITADANRLTVGGTNTVWYYRNMPAVAPEARATGQTRRLLPARGASTSPATSTSTSWPGTVTGNCGWSTPASGACARWTPTTASTPAGGPPFVSALAPEDRCHLNGLAMVDGRPKYVTALGETDTPRRLAGEQGARRHADRRRDRRDPAAGPLHAPLAPLVPGQALGAGIGRGQPRRRGPGTGKLEKVTETPGFTRGLDFYGPLAFIGLSQVRESAVFSGIPLVERLEERTCGVWVVHIETGQTVGFLRFEEGVQEIFAVQVLPNIRFPEMLEWDDPHLALSYVLPDEALAEVALPKS